MSDYAWIVDKDCLAKGKRGSAGTCGPCDAPDDLLVRLKAGEGRRWRCLDDDGEVYFEGRILTRESIGVGSESDFGPLDDFAKPDSGAVAIEYKRGNSWDIL